MARELIAITGVAPSHWAGYFINGDADSLDSEERAQADAFAEWLGGVPCSCEEYGFSWSHDAMRFGALAANCETYTAIVECEI